MDEIAQGHQRSSGDAAAADDDDDDDEDDDGLSSKNAGLVRIWIAMQTTLCGQSTISEEMISKSSRNIKLGNAGVNPKLKRN